MNYLNYKKWHKEKFNFCCITGSTEKLEQHHVVSVGMGNNRNKNIPEHLTVVMLSKWIHHELHATGIKTFQKKYNINLFEQVITQQMKYFHDQVQNKALCEEFRNMDYLK